MSLAAEMLRPKFLRSRRHLKSAGARDAVSQRALGEDGLLQVKGRNRCAAFLSCILQQIIEKTNLPFQTFKIWLKNFHVWSLFRAQNVIAQAVYVEPAVTLFWPDPNSPMRKCSRKIGVSNCELSSFFFRMIRQIFQIETE